MTFQKEHQRQRPHHPDQNYPLYQDEKQKQKQRWWQQKQKQQKKQQQEEKNDA